MSTKKLMRRGLLFLACLAPMFGSQSVAWNSAIHGGGLLPGSGSGNWWGSLTNYDVEVDVTGFVSTSAIVGLWEIDSNEKIIIDSSNNVSFLGSHSETGFLSLQGCTSFRIRWQRNTSTAHYTLELWCESTGVYSLLTVADTNTAAVNRANYHFAIGSFYEPTNPTINFGAIRIFSANVALGSAPPPRLLSGAFGVPSPPRARVRRAPPLRLGPNSFGDLTDFEFEGNMTDSSPLGLTFAFSSGSASYVATPVTNPALLQSSNTLLVGATGVATAIGQVIAFANNDNAVLNYAWTQASGPTGTFSNASTSSPTFTPSAFGTAYLQLVVTDASSNATTVGPIKFGGVVLLAGAQNVDIATEAGGGATGSKIASLLIGTMIFGADPWSWYDNRFVTAANQQIANTPTYFIDYWNNNATGTISCTNGSATCTGVGTTFQTDFCGGGTTPVSGNNPNIVIHYPSQIPAYAGTFGNASYGIIGCPSQTTITLARPWVHTSGSLTTNVAFAEDPTGVNYGYWRYSSIPANYYDNVLAYYRLYYKTGIDTYLTAARGLAQKWFQGIWDYGYSFNVNQIGGCCIVAGPGRGISPAGVVLWGLESGTNIWPGIEYLWAYEGLLIPGAVSSGQIGDLRDGSYIASIEGLCVLYDPNYASLSCGSDITNAVDNWWTPLKTTGVLAAPAVNNTYASTQAQGQRYYANGQGGCTSSPCYVTTTNGSTLVTLTGGTFNCASDSSGTFNNNSYNNNNVLAPLWFFNDYTNANIPGNSNGGDANHGPAGDNEAYTINPASCTSTTVNLAAPYAGTTGPHGLLVSTIVGFGDQGYEAGIASGLFGDWNYKAFQKLGQPTEMANALAISQNMMNYIVNYEMPANFQLYYGRGFLNCEGYVNTSTPPSGWTPQNDPGCAGEIDTNVEIMHGCVVNYLLNPSPALRTFCDQTMTAMFCKPGYTCAGYPQIGGTYSTDLDDSPIGFDITTGPGGQSQATTNKWFGYFFGISYADAWAVVRQGGQPLGGGPVAAAGAVAGSQVVH